MKHAQREVEASAAREGPGRGPLLPPVLPEAGTDLSAGSEGLTDALRLGEARTGEKARLGALVVGEPVQSSTPLKHF